MTAPKIRGFSLIELAIVLTIMSVMIGSAMLFISGSTTQAKYEETLMKMEKIEKAIASYTAIKNRLPCPSNVHLALSNENAGYEFCYGSCTAVSATGHTVNSVTLPCQSLELASFPTNYSQDPSYSYDYIIGGGVPFVALDLPPEFALDGWGNQFEYINTGQLTAAHGNYGATTSTFYIFAMESGANMGFVEVNDITDAERTNAAAYVIISHGPNGYGGFNADGQQNTAPTDANEIKNYWNMGNASITNSFVSSQPTATFDDIVHYKMKYQVVKEAGAVLSNTNCTVANTVFKQVENAGGVNYYCGSNPGDANCSVYINNLAIKVRDLCLNQ